MDIPHESAWIEYNIIKILPQKTIIYFLYDKNNEIIYVGQTTSFLLRFDFHIKSKHEIWRIKYFIIDSALADEAEKYLIGKYKPKHNINYNPDSISTNYIELNPDWLVNFGSYLEKNRISVTKFSKTLGCSRIHLSEIVNGRRVPSLMLAKLIEKETNGEVTVKELLKGENS